ncbi:MAG TPA: hypothetical protein VJQ56_09395, partial [Blastocatellia bacterium]|nr:hypothetical protein [Blastocatellia bacterium]
MKVKRLLILTAFLFAAYPANAQEHPNQANPFDAERTYNFDEIDSINSFNGSLGLNIPIGHEYLINGDLKFSLAIFYSSSVWKTAADASGTSKVTPGGPEDRIPFNAGLGWHVSLGQLLVTSLAPNQMLDTSYVAPDGTRHSFTKTLLGSIEDPGDGGATQKIVYTGDGSFLRLRVLAGPRYAVDFPNGVTHTFNNQGLLEKVEGPFNNASLGNQQITVAYSADRNTWTITDSHSRT